MRIQFNVNHKKAIEAVLWILHQNNKVDVYHLMKILFHADMISLNKYASPVTGDNYIAMRLGTVPDYVYNALIKKDMMYLMEYEQEANDIPIVVDKYNLFPKREANKDYLSETDIECIDIALNEYSSLSFDEVKEKNHSIKAWQKAFNKAPNSYIDWYDVIESDEVRLDLSNGWSKHMVV